MSESTADTAAAVHRAHQKIRRDDEIGKEHAHDHRQRADADGDRGHFLRFVFPVEKTRREHIRARCDNVHDDAVDPALGAHGKALNECGDQRDDESRSRAERKAADQNGNIRRVVFKERDRRKDRKMDQRNKADGECRQDRHRRQFTGVCHGKGPFLKKIRPKKAILRAQHKNVRRALPLLLPSRLYCRSRSCTESALRLADFTAGREFHLALKNSSIFR